MGCGLAEAKHPKRDDLRNLMKEPSVSEVRTMAADALIAFEQIFASLLPAQMI
jgi:hypothetical protein